MQQVQTCGNCSSNRHLTNMCPMLRYESSWQFNEVGGFQQQQYDFYSNNYNSDWGDYSDFSYGGGQHMSYPSMPRAFQQQPPF